MQRNDFDQQGVTGRVPTLRRLVWPSWASRKQTIARQLWFIVIAASVAVLAALIWPDDLRQTNRAYVAVSWLLFMFRTFAFHGGLALLIVVGIALMLRRRKLAATAGLVAAMMVSGELRTMWPTASAGTPTDRSTLRVMSANLLVGNNAMEGIVAEIRASQADVVMLQEYSRAWHTAMQSGVGRLYPHVAYRTREDSFGIAIYSKHPFIDEPEIMLPLGSHDIPQVRAVVHFDGRNIALYNIHLLPPFGFDYVIETRKQFADLAGLLAEERLPVILAGDFNFTSACTQTGLLADLGFRDSHAWAGSGRGTTWPNHPTLWFFPSLMLDHIYLSRELCALSHGVGVGEQSDHRPITAEIAISAK